ncbi:DNA-3-methyladenine glycosylase family protein [Salinarimonas ramus]|uniref:DNA-3-methyladenine glycosylase II n=1 Tax=Salinarimonas ramus TaxID=690164 RepID=A0A917Q7G9_9HYPH|nr:DNA-3-methyladenine glycosylase 2 family protein [Salinarimonas ramus]GGK31797.1 DNA-3-methyladenine glycosidase [Salinarimonas ramus]
MDARLDSEERLRLGLAELVARDPALARALAEGSVPRLRKRPEGLAGLAWIVVGQQVSVASAAAINARLEAAFPEMSAQALLAASDEEMRAVGLSRPKVRTLRAIAEAVASGALPLADLGAMPADQAHARLVSVHGIGPWTADVYLLFCLGHADAFAAGDLALQEAARLVYGLETRPDAKALNAMAEAWRPWRGVAAKLLWAHYRRVTGRAGTGES